MFYMQDSGWMLNVTETWEIWGSESSVYENLGFWNLSGDNW